jgi:hypothetical protein
MAPDSLRFLYVCVHQLTAVRCLDLPCQLLEKNRTLVDELVKTLLEVRTIRQDDFQEMVEKYGNLEEEPPQPLQIREEQSKAFREEMFAGKVSRRE